VLEGSGEFVIGRLSFFICHLRIRLRRDVRKKQLREAPPQATNEK
jgi:hypothetical protein